jgi:ATP-binding cassette subfamily B protein/subfamily B ATP-binding cassette protein MsbA
MDRVLDLVRTNDQVAESPDATPLDPTPSRAALEFRSVTFGYEPDREVLKGLSLALRPGMTVAVVGATGAGKSTLAGLALRLFDPWRGEVLVCGQDAMRTQLASLRSGVGIVLQESFLLPLSIAENIGLGRLEASRGEIEAAARVAQAHDFIRSLPEGYDTILGERGATLSGGERQRLSIARAVLKDAPILILDEATSALDSETESSLLDALAQTRRSRTTLVIAHRLATARRADLIAVMENGRIVELGGHDELMRADGAYALLWREQLRARERPAVAAGVGP